MPPVYRPEIDGLRAIAVLSVVLYHAGVPGFGGGFVGVDIFFVISGHLITGILLRALAAGQFSLLQFYARRVRRILPALAVVLVASVLAALWLLFDTELASFGRSLFATVLFHANLHFMHNTGYFAAPALGMPLLHMWSLAVEEQFYLLFPLLLCACWRWWRRGLLPLTWALALASLAGALWLMAVSPDQAFYATPARAWELLAGALLAMHLQRRPQPLGRVPAEALAWAGLLALLAPVLLYTDNLPFPGVAALPPVLGSALLIGATTTPGNSVVRLLSLPPLRWVGLVSYSLYLWHWPVLVFAKAYAVRPLSGPETLALVLASGVLAVLSWRWVEQPWRRGGGSHQRVLLAGGMVLGLGVACAALLVLSQGLPARLDSGVRRILAVADDTAALRDCAWHGSGAARIQLCRVGADGPPSFAVWGDSHAKAMLPAIDTAARSAGRAGLAFMRGGCPPLLGVRQTLEGFRDCADKAEAFVQHLAGAPELAQVILVARWAVYASGERFLQEPGRRVTITDDVVDAPSVATNGLVFARGLGRSLGRLQALGRQTVVVTQVPESEFRLPQAMAQAQRLGHPLEFAPLRADYEARQAPVAQAFDRLAGPYALRFVHPAQLLCGQQLRCSVSAGGLPIYRDSNHLSATHARALAPLFVPLFKQLPTPVATAVPAVGASR